MFKINLIKKGARINRYRETINRIRLLLIILVPIFITLYLVVFISLIIEQRKLNVLTQNSINLLESNSNLDKNVLAEADYGYKKFNKIKEVYALAPEYYSQYEYLLKILLSQEGLSINRFTINSESIVDLTLSVPQFTDTINIIEILKSKQNLDNFKLLQVEGINFSKSSNREEFSEEEYKVDIKIQFIDSFKNEKT
jgi:predicted glycosyltransferase involved in capsule biosynthesis